MLEPGGNRGHTVSVKLTPVCCRVLVTLALFPASAARVAAQNVLFARYEGKSQPVLQVRGIQPYVQVEGKLVAADERELALQKVGEFLPVFVVVKDVDVKTSYVDVSGASINREFTFQATLESPLALTDVFVLLDLETEKAGRIIYLREVGQLTAREAMQVSIGVPLTTGLGSGKYTFHLFSQGMEVLQSQIPPQVRDEALDRMIAKRLPPGPDAPPRLFIGPEPEYPEAMLPDKSTGQAVIKLRIGANGRVYDPEIKSATAPAFGMAALKAVRLWRFIPRLKAGQPVETKADIPISFNPPGGPAKKS